MDVAREYAEHSKEQMMNQFLGQNAKISVMGGAQLSQVMQTVSKYAHSVVTFMAPLTIIQQRPNAACLS